MGAAYGLWVLWLMLTKGLWQVSSWDVCETPPPCLVDTSYGERRYLQLKVHRRGRVEGTGATLGGSLYRGSSVTHLWAEVYG